jgi:hypothetical protein
MFAMQCKSTDWVLEFGQQYSIILTAILRLAITTGIALVTCSSMYRQQPMKANLLYTP